MFAANTLNRGLQRVSADGGEPETLTRPDVPRGEDGHVWPEYLPGGHAVLFTITPNSNSMENAQIAVLNLKTRLHKVVVPNGSHAHYVSSGHLVYGVAGTLRASEIRLGPAGDDWSRNYRD